MAEAASLADTIGPDPTSLVLRHLDLTTSWVVCYELCKTPSGAPDDDTVRHRRQLQLQLSESCSLSERLQFVKKIDDMTILNGVSDSGIKKFPYENVAWLLHSLEPSATELYTIIVHFAATAPAWVGPVIRQLDDMGELTPEYKQFILKRMTKSNVKYGYVKGILLKHVYKDDAKAMAKDIIRLLWDDRYLSLMSKRSLRRGAEFGNIVLSVYSQLPDDDGWKQRVLQKGYALGPDLYWRCRYELRMPTDQHVTVYRRTMCTYVFGYDDAKRLAELPDRMEDYVHGLDDFSVCVMVVLYTFESEPAFAAARLLQHQFIKPILREVKRLFADTNPDVDFDVFCKFLWDNVQIRSRFSRAERTSYVRFKQFVALEL